MNRSYRIENNGETPIVLHACEGGVEHLHVIAPGMYANFQESLPLLPTETPLSVSVMPQGVTLAYEADLADRAGGPALTPEQVKEMVRHEVAHAMGAALKAEDKPKPKPKPKPRPPKADAR